MWVNNLCSEMEFLLLLLILAVIQTMQLWYFVIMLFNLKKNTYSFSSFVLYTQTPRKPVFFYIVYKMKVYLPWLGCRFALYKIHTFLSQPCHTFPLQNTHLPLTTMPHPPSTKYIPSNVRWFIYSFNVIWLEYYISLLNVLLEIIGSLRRVIPIMCAFEDKW